MTTIVNIIRFVVSLIRAERRYRADVRAGGQLTYSTSSVQSFRWVIPSTWTVNSGSLPSALTCTHPKEWLTIYENGAGYEAGDYDTVVCRCCGAVVEPDL